MGRDTAIVLKNEREIVPPQSAGMLHDESGVSWPQCSLLIARFDGWIDEPTKRERALAKDYFGRTKIGAGELTLPPKALSSWRRLGEVTDIFYDRAGAKAPGYFHHRFHKPRGLWKIFFFFKRAAKLPVVLYAYGRSRTYRLDLPDGCIIDDRGIALP